MRRFFALFCAPLFVAGGVVSPRAHAFVPPTWHQTSSQRALLGAWQLVSVGGHAPSEALGAAVVTLDIDATHIVTRYDEETKQFGYRTAVDEDGMLSLHVVDEDGATRWTADVLLESASEMTLYYRAAGSDDDVGTALHFERAP